MEKFQDWVFHYNPYTEVWTAFERKNYMKYFNGELKDHEIYRSKDINVLFGFMKRDFKK